VVRSPARIFGSRFSFISTGCRGYVTEISLEQLLDASLNGGPWMAHFVLHMFDFGATEEILSRHGYVTEKLEGLFSQRRIDSTEERQQCSNGDIMTNYKLLARENTRPPCLSNFACRAIGDHRALI
jgi:hypothetical protein